MVDYHRVFGSGLTRYESESDVDLLVLCTLFIYIFWWEGRSSFGLPVPLSEPLVLSCQMFIFDYLKILFKVNYISIWSIKRFAHPLASVTLLILLISSSIFFGHSSLVNFVLHTLKLYISTLLYIINTIFEPKKNILGSRYDRSQALSSPRVCPPCQGHRHRSFLGKLKKNCCYMLVVACRT
jgi:hypothetical protein